VDTDAATCCVRSISLAVRKLEGVDGPRPFCTPDDLGAVLAVFWSGPGYHGTITRVVSINQAAPATPFIATYHGVPVEAAKFGADYSHGQIVPIRSDAPAHPAVPADAVTASASGLDPEIKMTPSHGAFKRSPDDEMDLSHRTAAEWRQACPPFERPLHNARHRCNRAQNFSRISASSLDAGTAPSVGLM
jgi:hypothetical protein